ncbi:nuclear transport factor 2 family protein [Actinomadura litoris]|uniref:nuclear transport factor 2 family protein n=1 Tax=Actinomadura litoris TaxID=2678616 RepID=UPI001FA772A5|nr:nuclear transport factor 2 family protein [Actinomadura litoris]
MSADATDRTPPNSEDEQGGPDRHKATVRTFLRLLEEKDIDSWIELWAEDAEHYYPFGTEMFPPHLHGKQAIYDNWRTVPDLFDSLRFPIHDIWADRDSDTLIARFDSDNVMKGGDRKYQNTYVCIFKFDAHGKICEYWEYFDPIVTGLTYRLAEVRYLPENEA